MRSEKSQNNKSMKPIKIIAGGLLMFFALSATCAERTIFVNGNAVDGGDGSKNKPFRTIVQARDAIRAWKKTGAIKPDDRITVLVSPGVYRLENTFELTAEDSGTAGNPIIYRAEKYGTVNIHGGVTLPAGAFRPVTDKEILKRIPENARGKVLVCNLSGIITNGIEEMKPRFQGAPASPWLYFNGQPMTLARWPNTNENNGWAEFSKAVDTGLPKSDSPDPAMRKLHPGSFIFENDRPLRWNINEGVWLLGYWTHDWSEEIIKIGSYDPQNKVITLAEPHHYGIAAGTWGAAKRRFFAFNLLDELDAPGEWYLDRTRRLLYLYPPADMNNANIVLATLTKPMVKIIGASHIKLIGFNFEYSHSDGLILQNTRSVEIAGCRIANLAGSGISVDGYENIVRSCDIYNLGKSGISLNGGDRKNLINANNVAENNHIHHYGIFQRTYAPGIGANGCGQIARNNRIHDAPHNAFLYGGNEHLFEKNEVYRVVLETGDAGAFYTGRDWTSQGNVLRYNYIHDLGSGDPTHVNTMGVYLDDCDCGDTIDGNIFYRAGRAIMIGGGRDNYVLNNIVFECPIGLHIDSRGTTWKQWNNPSDPSWHLEAKAQKLNYTQPPWSVKYPKLARIMQEDPQWPLGNVVRRNIFVDCSKRVCDFDGNVRKILDKLDIDENLVINRTGKTNIAVVKDIKGFKNLIGTQDSPVDPGFVNPSLGNFALKQGTTILKEVPSFKPIPVAEIGIYIDDYRKTIPPKN